MKDFIIIFVISALIIILFAITDISYHKSAHSDDVMITEWISPDGVHYWYQKSGNHAMLTPRYDCDGNLVLDKKGDNNEVD